MISGGAWEDIICAYGDTNLPSDLADILRAIDETIKDANGMRNGLRDEYGIRSTQMIGLIIYLYKKGILK